jgi:hypothetical protein
MPKFLLNLSTNNAAFQPDPTPEIARVLRAVADRIESGDTYDTFRNILDENGNVAGTFALKPDDYR